MAKEVKIVIYLLLHVVSENGLKDMHAVYFASILQVPFATTSKLQKLIC